jgi:hypothetical protein
MLCHCCYLNGCLTTSSLRSPRSFSCRMCDGPHYRCFAVMVLSDGSLAAMVVSRADALPLLSCRLPWLPWWMLLEARLVAIATTLHHRLPMCCCLPVIGSVCKGLVMEAPSLVLSCCFVCICGTVLVILGLPASPM